MILYVAINSCFYCISCQQSEGITPNPKIVAKDLSREEVFREIFFYQGDVVEKFSSIRKSRETIQTTFDTNLEAEQVYQKFTDLIEKILKSAKFIIKDAGYLTDYKNIFELSDELEAKEVVIFVGL